MITETIKNAPNSTTEDGAIVINGQNVAMTGKSLANAAWDALDAMGILAPHVNDDVDKFLAYARTVEGMEIITAHGAQVTEAIKAIQARFVTHNA